MHSKEPKKENKSSVLIIQNDHFYKHKKKSKSKQQSLYEMR